MDVERLPSDGSESRKLAKGLNRLWTRTEKRQWLGTLFLGNSCLYLVRTVMPVCAASISAEFRWNKAETGFVLSTFFWGYTMTQVLGGWLSDRVGGDRVIAGSCIFWLLLTVVFPRLPDFLAGPQLLYCMVLLRVLIGASQGFFYPSFSSLLSMRVLEKERGVSFSIISSGAHCGTLICGSLGSLLLEYVGWRATFYSTALLGGAWLIFLRYCIMDTNVELASEAASEPSHGPVPWCKLLVAPPFWALVFTHVCQNYAFFILLSWLPTYFHETFPDASGWVFNVVPWLINIPSSILCGWLADTLISWGKSPTTVRKGIESVCLLGIAFFLTLIGYTTSYASALCCAALAVGCTGFHNGGVLVNPGDIAPKHAGSVFGLMNMAGAVPGFLGVYIAGHILAQTHSWTAVFQQTAVVCTVGWVVFTGFGTAKRIV